MRNVSKNFKNELKTDNRNYLLYADVALSSGEMLNLTREEIWENRFILDDATSGTSSFDLGSVIINKFTLTINNIYDDFSKYDFTDATVVAHIGLGLPDGTVEKIRMGTFTVDEPTYNGSTITLECLDNIRLLDEPYSKSTLQYPATLLQIAMDACECCGLRLNTRDFEHSDYVVESRPDDEATTFREVMSWVAQIACKYVKCDACGRIYLGWYDESDFVEEFVLTDERENKIHTDDSDEIIIFAEPSKAKTSVDGGRFDKDTPYSSGDNLDGGLFNPWDDDGETNYDAGTFDAMKTYHHIWLLNSLTVGTDDITITGVSVVLENESGESSTYLYGDTGYVLSIEKNDLIQTEEQAKNVAVMVGEKLVGMTFRTFSAGHLSDPTIEAGDTVYVTDRKQNSYKSYITNTVFTAGGTQKSSCGAETPARRSSTRFTEATKALAAAKKNTTQQINTYDKSVQALTNLITQSFGVYKSEEKLDDGSTIFYMHNKPTLEESDTIWKMTADAFAVSTDCGRTWNAGMDSQGNAVVNVLSAIGIRFDWAKGGTLTLGGENNVNGVLQVLDSKGNVITTLNASGADIFGSITTKSREHGYSVTVKDGAVTLYDPDGKRIGMFGWIGINENNTWRYVPYMRAIGNKEVSIEMDPAKGSMNITAESFSVSSSPGKSGKAEFSDGSYLQFVNGILVSGKTADGTTF